MDFVLEKLGNIFGDIVSGIKWFFLTIWNYFIDFLDLFLPKNIANTFGIFILAIVFLILFMRIFNRNK